MDEKKEERAVRERLADRWAALLFFALLTLIFAGFVYRGLSAEAGFWPVVLIATFWGAFLMVDVMLVYQIWTISIRARSTK
jgi:hypothetical protein